MSPLFVPPAAPPVAANKSQRRRLRVLPGHIEPCAPEIREAALRGFVEGMAALATELLLDGELESPQASNDPATNTQDDTVAA